MRVAHVLASVDDPDAGPSYSVPALCRGLQAQGADVALHTVAGWRSSGPGTAGLMVRRHSQDFATTPILDRLCFSSSLSRALTEEARAGAILHSHGLWLMPNVYPASAAKDADARFVLSPRGMLGEAALRFSSSAKALVWRVMQKRAAQAADCLHATAASEYEELRAAGLRGPVAVIPNGVDLPAAAAPRPREGKVVLSLGRIHPKKGLADLIRAWRAVDAEAAGWRLQIVGPDEIGHGRELVALAASLGLGAVSIEGPANGPDRDRAYAEASLFVLPSLNENFAMTVAEALAAGAPVIATRGAPWADLARRGCGWWVDVGPEGLADGLRQAISTPPRALAAMGTMGRDWMAAEFSWDGRARQMLEVYGWLQRGGDAPSTVRMD